MRNFLKTFLIILVLFPAWSTAAIEEKAQIKQAVEEHYIRGLQVRDFELIRKICLPMAVLMSTGQDGKLHLTTLDMWSKRFDPDNPPFKKLEYSILKIDWIGTAAQVKIQFVADDKDLIIDFLNMLKIEGEWRIANIIDY